MSVIKSFPDRYASKVATILMLDEEINKMLYYNDKNDVDIYTLPRVKNPVGTPEEVSKVKESYTGEYLK